MHLRSTIVAPTQYQASLFLCVYSQAIVKGYINAYSECTAASQN